MTEDENPIVESQEPGVDHALEQALLTDVVRAFERAEKGLAYSIELVRLVDNVETRRLTVQGERFEYTDGEDNHFDANQACYDHLSRVRHDLRLAAVREVIRKITTASAMVASVEVST